MNLRALLTTEEWDWINHWAQGRGIGYERGYAIGDSRKPKIANNWSREHRGGRSVIENEYCEYKRTDPRFKQRVKR